MKKVTNYVKLLGIVLGYILVISLIMSLIYYFGNISYRTISSIILVMILILFFYLGFRNGKGSKSKGYLAGLKIGAIFVGIMFLFNLLFIRTFKLPLFMYYLLLIMSSVLGGMLGINRKKN